MRRMAKALGRAVLAVSAIILFAWLANARIQAPTDLAGSDLLRSPGLPWNEPKTIRVATYNIAAGYLFTANREARVRAIARKLTELDPDVVGLQEAFIASDRELLLRELAGSRLQHHVRFPGALVGNGLWILSAFPIQESWFHRFKNSNPWYRIGEGDFWAGKGVGLARLRLPDNRILDFYNTHAQAGRGNPSNEQVRDGQMAELVEFLRRSRTPAAPALVLGDFNTRPGAPDYQRLVRDGSLEPVLLVPSEIDHVFAVSDARYRYEPLATEEIHGETDALHAGIFLSRAPTLGEWWRMNFGSPGKTAWSDHPGYLATLRIEPVPETQSIIRIR